MARYIDADALKTIQSIQKADFNSIKTIQEWIDDAPTADVRENVKGKWLFVEYPDGYYHAECLKCGQWVDEDVYLKDKWNFCPNCGVYMRQDDQSHPFADDVMMKGESDE